MTSGIQMVLLILAECTGIVDGLYVYQHHATIQYFANLHIHKRREHWILCIDPDCKGAITDLLHLMV
jgi:hypothetical protein